MGDYNQSSQHAKQSAYSPTNVHLRAGYIGKITSSSYGRYIGKIIATSFNRANDMQTRQLPSERRCAISLVWVLGIAETLGRLYRGRIAVARRTFAQCN
jgi:hypothetical protein